MFGWFKRSLQKLEPWRSMHDAPRDGTPIEIRCTYGVTPWVKTARHNEHPIDGAIWQITEGQFVTYVEDTWDYRGRYQGAKNTDLQWRPLA